MNIHQTQYTYGDTVYLKTDPEQNKRMVTSLTLWPGGSALYEVVCGTETSSHYDIEMTAQPDQNMRLGIEEKE